MHKKCPSCNHDVSPNLLGSSAWQVGEKLVLESSGLYRGTKTEGEVVKVNKRTYTVKITKHAGDHMIGRKVQVDFRGQQVGSGPYSTTSWIKKS